MYGRPSLLSCSALSSASPCTLAQVDPSPPSTIWSTRASRPCPSPGLQNSLGQHIAEDSMSIQGAEAYRRAQLSGIQKKVTNPRSYRDKTNLLILWGPTPLPGTLLLGSFQRGLGASLWGAWRHPLLSFSHVLLHLPFRQAKLALLITWVWPTSLLTGITPILVISRTVGWCLKVE